MVDSIPTNPARLCFTSVIVALLAFALVPLTSAEENANYRHSYIDNDFYIRVVTLWSTQQLENTDVAVSPVDNPPPISPSLLVCAYRSIDTQATVTHVIIEFWVPRAWLEQNHVEENDVVLLMLDNDWRPLSTSENENMSSENYIYYVAYSSGLSVFAIAGRPTGQPPALLGVLIVVAGVIVASLVYWFLIRPRRMFTSLKKLRHEVGQEKYAPPPTVGQEAATKVKRLGGAAAPRLPQPKVERLKAAKPKKISAEGDIAILKRLKKKAVEEESRGKQT